MAVKPDIELHIEEMVLHGFRPGDRQAIAGAVQTELRRLLGEHGLSPALAKGIEATRVDGGAFNAKANSKPETIGEKVAGSIYKGINS